MFLATTAFEDFWDKNQEILFLGEWCKVYDKRDSLKNLKYQTLAFEWDNSEKINNAYDYCSSVYEKSLQEFTDILNRIHKLDKSKEYYRVILGNWLMRFIHQYYDKYISIQNAIKKSKNLNTFILDKRFYYIAFDYKEYMHLQMTDDIYNLQMYSDIILYSDIKYCIKSLNKPIVINEHISINNDIKSKILSFSAKILNYISKINFFDKKKLVIVDPYFKYNRLSNILLLFFKSKFRFKFDDFRYSIDVNNKIDYNLRGRTKLMMSSDDFETMLSNTIFNHVPSLFLESFIEFRDKVKNLNIKNTQHYFTSQALHANMVFKFFVAENIDNVSVYTHQHGGTYGLNKKVLQEDYERSLSKIYFTWGWDCDKCQVLPFPKHKSKRKNKNDFILFVMATSSRYIYVFQFLANSTSLLDIGLNQTNIFLKNIRTDKLILRPHPAQIFKIFLTERVKEKSFDIAYDDLSKNFDEMLSECKLFVSDNLTTAWLEALAMNKPTVVFTSKKYLAFREEALPFIQELEEAKILFFDSLKAVEHINKIENNIDKWWKTEKVQNARLRFIKVYAYTDDNWIDIWIDKLSEVLEEE